MKNDLELQLGPIVGMAFVSAETLDMSNDVILLRIRGKDNGVAADAIVRLDVQCYVNSSDPSDLLDIIKDHPLPTKFSELDPQWFSV